MRHIIALLLENESGALARVVGLFAQRGYNIDSLTVAATEDPTMSRLTMVTRGDDQVIEQITKQLHKLIEVVKLVDLSESAHIERELMMVKVMQLRVVITTDIDDGDVRICQILRQRFSAHDGHRVNGSEEAASQQLIFMSAAGMGQNKRNSHEGRQ